MRKLIFCFLVFFALLALVAVDARSQTRLVRRLADVHSIYVDRDSFEIEGPPCNKAPGKIFKTCGDDLKKREKFLDALERWIGKYGIKVTKDARSADAVLRGFIEMEEEIIATSTEPGSDEQWHIDAWLENRAGDTLWKSGALNAPKPGYGWSSISKIKGKELAKEIEWSIRNAR